MIYIFLFGEMLLGYTKIVITYTKETCGCLKNTEI